MDVLGFRPPAPVRRLATWLLDASPWRVLAIATGARALVCGVWTTPNLDQWVAFARDPYGPAPIEPVFHYITGSPLGPLLAHGVGADTRLTYALLHLGALAAAVVMIVAMGRRLVGDRVTSLFVLLLFASSLSNVLLTWLGQPDPFVLGGLSVIGLASAIGDRTPRQLAVGCAGVVIGFASFEQGVVAVAALAALSWWSERPRDREVVITSLLGIVAGKLGVAAFLIASDVPHQSRLEYVRDGGIGVFVRAWLFSLPALAFSLFGAGWLVVGHSVGRLCGVFPNPWPVRAALVIVFAAAAVALDETRVAAIVAWPATVWLVRRADEHSDGGLDPTLAALVLLGGLVLPPVVIWEGSPYISSWEAIRDGW